AFQSAWMSLPQPPRVVHSQDGPRTDLQDVTTYVHYPIDASVPAQLRGRLAAVRNAAGHITRIEAYDVFGTATKTVDPNGVVTELAADTLGRVTTSTIKGIAGCDTATDPLCATDLTSTTVYAGAGPAQTEQRPGGGVTTYTYDGRGRVRTISRGPSTADLRERIEYSYDPATGKKSLEVIYGFESGAWVETKRESYAYDADGDLRTLTHADSASVAYTYDEDGRIATVRDENHTSANATYSYDAAGRTSKVTQIAPTPTGSITTSYAYDRHGNLTAVTDPNGNVTTYTYDDFGQMLSQVSPVTGTTTYRYDAAGNTTLTSAANGTSTARTYDALNRPLTSVSAPQPETVSWTYDSATPGWFDIGRMASMTASVGSTAYRYDRRGLLIQEAAALNGQPGGPVTFTTRFRHDSDGNRSAIFYPSTALTVSYTHDHAGRPTGIPGILLEAKYLPFGPLSRLRFANGTTQTLEHDVRDRVQWNTLTADATGTPIARYEYGYDAAGNITSIDDDLDPAYDRSFTYDDLNRLTRADTGTSLWRTGEYKWDAMGNILSLALGEIEKGPDDGLARTGPRPKIEENRPLGRTSKFTYTGTTPVLAEVTTNDLTRTVTHDAAGNELSHVVTRTYSSRNLLTQVTDESEPGSSPHWYTYGYDGRGVRVRQIEGHYDGVPRPRFFLYTPELQLLAVTQRPEDNPWDPPPPRPPTPMNVDYEIVWLGSRPIAQVMTGGPTFYTVADHMGTPFLQTNSSATTVWHAEYEPFGNVYAMRAGTRT
ncbi:MAG TPA: hypothetical protein VEU30_06920, partial [Thermoanaerobaculia bacterium]|nr:hypothetical protein [Thermoanaerobaculia bacterium]